MSATTTQTRVQNGGSFHSAVLRDYELHHSQSREETSECQTSPALDHPEFDLPHRRVPAYRAPNRDAAHIDGVRVYTSTPELFFITAMFRGLSFNAVSDTFWR